MPSTVGEKLETIVFLFLTGINAMKIVHLCIKKMYRMALSLRSCLADYFNMKYVNSFSNCWGYVL